MIGGSLQYEELHWRVTELGMLSTTHCSKSLFWTVSGST